MSCTRRPAAELAGRRPRPDQLVTHRNGTRSELTQRHCPRCTERRCPNGREGEREGGGGGGGHTQKQGSIHSNHKCKRVGSCLASGDSIFTHKIYHSVTSRSTCPAYASSHKERGESAMLSRIHCEKIGVRLTSLSLSPPPPSSLYSSCLTPPPPPPPQGVIFCQSCMIPTCKVLHETQRKNALPAKSFNQRATHGITCYVIRCSVCCSVCCSVRCSVCCSVRCSVCCSVCLCSTHRLMSDPDFVN